MISLIFLGFIFTLSSCMNRRSQIAELTNGEWQSTEPIIKIIVNSGNCIIEGSGRGARCYVGFIKLENGETMPIRAGFIAMGMGGFAIYPYFENDDPDWRNYDPIMDGLIKPSTFNKKTFTWVLDMDEVFDFKYKTITFRFEG
jgi:hypothetical protein